MKMKTPNQHEVLAKRLQADAEALPACPPSMHARVLEGIAEDEADIQVGISDSFGWRRAYPAFAAAALITLIGIIATSLQKERPLDQVAQAPSETLSAEITGINLNPAVAVQLPSALETAVSTPYQNELKNLGRDVQGAARFLMSQLGSSVPSGALSDAEPQG